MGTWYKQLMCLIELYSTRREVGIQEFIFYQFYEGYLLLFPLSPGSFKKCVLEIVFYTTIQAHWLRTAFTSVTNIGYGSLT